MDTAGWAGRAAHGAGPVLGGRRPGARTSSRACHGPGDVVDRVDGDVRGDGHRAAAGCRRRRRSSTGSTSTCTPTRWTRCSRLGARPGPGYDGDDAWTVLLDPEGGELLRVRAATEPRRRTACYELIVDSVDPSSSALVGRRLGSEPLRTRARLWWWIGESRHAVRSCSRAGPEPKTVKNRIHWDSTATWFRDARVAAAPQPTGGARSLRRQRVRSLPTTGPGANLWPTATA